MHRTFQVAGIVASMLVPTIGPQPPRAGAPAKLQFRVWLDPALGSAAVSGRLIVLVTSNPKSVQVIDVGYGEASRDLSMVAKELEGFVPGTSVVIDSGVPAAPGPPSEGSGVRYQAMAFLDVDHNAAYETFTAGDLKSAVVAVAASETDSGGTIDLRLVERVPVSPVRLRPHQVAVDFVSPSLSAFWGRPIHMGATVITPPDYEKSKERYPVAYLTHGFGGNPAAPWSGGLEFFDKETAAGKLAPLIWVLLDEWCPFGTHEFVDSVNNGPWGQALTAELIPHLERTFRMDARSRSRLLNGHSSGGWATMWLQVRYPDVFGGTWSTSPDPVDFRDFINVDLRTASSLYKRADGASVPLVRSGGAATESVEHAAQREAVLGDYGGQLASFEAVFSPRGGNGRALPLFDRGTGEIHRDVADYWLERYDISRILVTRAAALAPRLRGKIHVIVGTADTFYLDGAVRLLEKAILPLRYDAKFTYLADRDHFNLYDKDVIPRIALQMYDTARPGHTWRPTTAFEPMVELAR